MTYSQASSHTFAQPEGVCVARAGVGRRESSDPAVVVHTKEANVRSVAITGISGYLGTQILKLLDQDKEIETVAGIDIKPPGYSTA